MYPTPGGRRRSLHNAYPSRSNRIVMSRPHPIEDAPVEESQLVAVDRAALRPRERRSVVDQLAGGVAHQIRNPLGAIANAAAVLGRCVDSDPNSDGRRALEIIQEEVRRANRIISELLNYTRVRDPAPSRYAVDELVEAALAVRPVPDGIDLLLELPAGLDVFADFDQMLTALAKIMTNAYEAMPNGGELAIRSAMTGNGSFVEIELLDTGPGIPEEEIHRIFDPLMTLKPHGVGLGLAIARSLAENQHGAVTAENRGDVGARFVLTVPLATRV